MAIGTQHPKTLEAVRHPDYQRRAAMLRELWATGMTVRDIAAKIGGGITKNGVAGMARRLGLPQRGSPIIGQLTPEEREKRKSRRLETQARLRVRAHGPTTEPPRNGRPVPGSPPASATANPARGTCQYIYNDGKPWLFCGAPGHPWCAEHQARVYARKGEGAQG